MSYWFSCEHLRLEMRRRTAETTRTALIRWWKTWRICCQISLSSHLPPKRKSRPRLVCSHFPISCTISQLALVWLFVFYLPSQMLSLRRAASLPKWSQARQPKGSTCKRMCHWLPPTPELQWPVPLDQGEGLLEMLGDLHLGLGEEEDRVDLQGNKNQHKRSSFWTMQSKLSIYKKSERK